jgi:hypothetical protein
MNPGSHVEFQISTKSKSGRGPSNEHFWQVWFKSVQWFREDEISNLYKGLSIDASYQVSDHLAKRFQRRFLEIDQSETRIACGGHVY